MASIHASHVSLSSRAGFVVVPSSAEAVWARRKFCKEKIEEMFAVIKSGGRQYKVTVGDKLEVNRLPHEDGKQIEIGEVLLVSDADTALVGAPFVEGAKVLATVVGQKRGEKLIVFKYKSKKRYRHRRGHRQELTVLSIDDIISKGKSLVSGEEPKAEAAPAKAKKGTTPTKAKKGTAPAKAEKETAPAEEVKSETQTAVAEQPVEEKKPRRRSSKKAQESSTEE